MPYFDKNRATKKVELVDADGKPNGYWVLLRHLTVAEGRELGIQAEKSPEDQKKAGEAGILKAILDWNIDETDGQKAPIDADHVEKLFQNDYLQLAEAYAEFEGAKPKATFPDGAAERNSAELTRASSVAAIPQTQPVVGEVGTPA
jgi:hypothetical protein